MAKNIVNQWDSRFLQRSRIFSDLQLVPGIKQWTTWPGCTGLMALFDTSVTLASGKTMKMVPQDEALPYPQMGYEERIYHTGMISTRERNWHDLFNALIWFFFPNCKIRLNALHISELSTQQGNKRTAMRDIITHFDESGIIIASTQSGLLSALRNHQWNRVFVHARDLWWKQIGAFVFGHGMYEKALQPFIGFTGKAYCIEVNEHFFQLDKVNQYKVLDHLLAKDILTRKTLSSKNTLTPLPMLGVPGWYDKNIDPKFYTDKNYFRPQRV